MDKRKLLSIISHGSIFLTATLVSVGIPLAIFVISDDQIVKENARESLNFHLNIWFWGVIATILTFVLIGWLLVPVLAIINIAMPAIAIWQVLNNPDKAFKYPLILRIL